MVGGTTVVSSVSPAESRISLAEVMNGIETKASGLDGEVEKIIPEAVPLPDPLESSISNNFKAFYEHLLMLAADRGVDLTKDPIYRRAVRAIQGMNDHVTELLKGKQQETSVRYKPFPESDQHTP